MPNLVPIRVVCHSGYKADEYPVCFYWDDIRFDIREISDRWYQGDVNPEYPAADYFKVQTISSGPFILKHEMKSDTWYLVI